MPETGYMLPDVINPDDSVCVQVQVPNDFHHWLAFWGALDTLGYWYNWKRDDNQTGTQVAQVWRDVIWDARHTTCGSETRPAAPEGQLPGPYGTASSEAEAREEETMPNIIYIEGAAYLVDDCGCGTKFFRLSEASVNLDAAGNVEILDPANDTAGYEFELDDSYLTCYAGKSVPYLLDRCLEFIDTYLGIMQNGLDYVAGGLDELFDIGAMVLDILGMDQNGFVDFIRGFDEGDIETAFNDATYRSTMESLWPYTGHVTRTQLQKWVEAGPAYVNSVPVKVFAQEWLSLSLIRGYNDQLRVYAGECENNTTLDDINQELTEQTLSYVHTDGKTYPIYIKTALSDDITDGADYNLQEPDPFEDGTGHLAVLVKTSATGVQNWSGSFWAKSGKWEGWTTDGNETTIGAYSDGNCYNALLAATGWTADHADSAATSASAGGCRITNANGNTITVTAYAICGQAVEDQT
jgi:hypothetical protein